jgi:ribose transport system ATP-binding protein
LSNAPSANPNRTSVVLMRRMTKRFRAVTALDRVDFEINPHEIVGLVGENGAGKSTLMKILVGLYHPDAGEFLINGKAISFKDSNDAMRHGIGMVFQDGCMIHNLSILDNVFLGHEEHFIKYGLMDKKRMRDECVKILAKVKVELDPDTLIRNVTSAEKQMVEIARLLWLLRFYGAENPVMILDEPTTVLQEQEVKTLFDTLRELKKSSSIILISHRLEEVIANSDRVVIFKDGKYIAQMPSANADIHQIEELMVGRGMLGNHYIEDKQREPAQRFRLELENVYKRGSFQPLSLSLREGEIISLVGLIGSGKEELCRCILGLAHFDGGRVLVEGKERNFRTPSDAIACGIGHVPIDRRNEGLALDYSVVSNINMLILRQLGRYGLIAPWRERENAGHWVDEIRVKTPSVYVKCGNLSGGNQQKVVIAKWLSSGVKILILDHPTRGIDIGAKEEIYKRIRLLSEAGMSLIIMCDTLEEDIGLGNRLVIMKDGSVTREVECSKEAKPTPRDIIEAIV